MTRVVSSALSISTPSARIAATVQRQSSLGRNPLMTQVPLLRDASITARCEMLLSPGTSISAWIVGARRIFQSGMRSFRLPQQIATGFGLGEKFGHRGVVIEQCYDFAKFFNHRFRGSAYGSAIGVKNFRPHGRRPGR